MRCRTGRTDSEPAVPGLSNDGTRRWAPSAPWHRGWSAPPPDGCAERSPPHRFPGTGRGERVVQIDRQLWIVAGGRGRHRTHHEVGTGWQPTEPLADQVAQSSFHKVADNGIADALRHDKTGTHTACRFGGRVRGHRVGRHQVHHERTTPGTATTTDRRGELTTTPETLRRGQHPMPLAALRPRGGCGPWTGAPRGSRARRGCACAAGSRGSSRAGGCSAGRCACSRRAPSQSVRRHSADQVHKQFRVTDGRTRFQNSLPAGLGDNPNGTAAPRRPVGSAVQRVTASKLPVSDTRTWPSHIEPRCGQASHKHVDNG